MKNIPLKIRKLKIDKSTNAIIPLDYATEDISESLEDVEKNFLTLKRLVKQQMRKIDTKKTGNALLHWELADLIYNFETDLKQKGFDFQNIVNTFVNHFGKKDTYWAIHRLFHRIYAKGELNDKIPWKMYLFLIRVKDDTKRKKLEEMILNGEIKNQETLRGLKDLSLSELNKKKPDNKQKMSISQKKVISALKKKSMSQDEIAKETGLSPDGVRGRITELRHRFNCNIEFINGKYHLGSNAKN